ncbi:MAG: hypothetical protein IT373_35675, partial [Polyangiaceae bacterium]|nr:hypothetical protein [Polyangiaceae bacterium]
MSAPGILRPRARTRAVPAAPGSGPGERGRSWLGEAAGLDDVERRMRTLALEAGGPVAGPMAVEQLATGGKRV